MKALIKGTMPGGSYTGPVNPPFTTFEKVVGTFTNGLENAAVNVHQVFICSSIHLFLLNDSTRIANNVNKI